MGRIEWRIERECEDAVRALEAAGPLPPPVEAAFRRKSKRRIWRLPPAPGVPKGAFLKQYLGRGGLLGFRDTLWISKTWREARRIRRFAAAGLPTPRLLAVGADWRGMLRDSTYLLTEAAGETRTIRNALRDADGPGRRAAIEAAARAVRGMHEAGFAHGDLHPDNILLRESPAGAVEVVFIDLPSSRGIASPAPRPDAFLSPLMAQDLAQVFAFSRAVCSMADARFALHAYLRAAGAERFPIGILREIADAMTEENLRRLKAASGPG